MGLSTNIVLFLVGGYCIQLSTQLPACNYVTEKATYLCENIHETFPRIYYGNYNLRCEKCEIKTFTPLTFPHENSLLSMNLSDSGVQLVATRAFQKLTNIRFLYMNNNKIASVSANAFQGLRQVENVEIEHNLIVDLVPGFVNDIQLNTLSLAYNRIAELPANAFAGSITLLNLNLQHNDIKTVHYDALTGVDALENLELQHNSLCHIPIGVFRELRELRLLNLANNKLAKFAPGAFSGLTRLNSLILANNSIQIFEGTELLSVPHLLNLDLSGNSIYYFETNFVYSSAPNLRFLNLEDNLWSCSILTNVIQFFASKRVEMEMSHGKFDVQNINGIVCVDSPVVEIVSKQVFLELARNDTMKYGGVSC